MCIGVFSLITSFRTQTKGERGSSFSCSIGGNIQIPGLNLLPHSEVKLDFPKKTIMNPRVDPAYNIEDSKRINIVFQKNGNEFYSVNFDSEEVPIGFVVGRNHEESAPFPIVNGEFGLRTFKINLEHSSVARYLPEIRLGHAYIKINPDETIEISDLGSLNGTYYSAASQNMVNLVFSKKITLAGAKAEKTKKPNSYSPRPTIETDLENLRFDTYYPFHNENGWVEIKQKAIVKNTGYLIRLGSVIFYVGPSKKVVSGGGKKKIA